MALLAAAFAAAPRASAQAPDPSPHSDAALVTDVASVRPGGTFDVALRLRLDSGWHAYWLNPGDSGLPVRIAWTLPNGVTAGPLRFPPPARYTLAGLTSYAHKGEAFFVTRVAVPPSASGRVTLRGTAAWLVCADVCLPAQTDVSLTVPVGDGTGRTADADALDAARAALPRPAEGWTAAAAATAAGYTLTLAPPAGVSLDGATFFPSEGAVLDHAATQTFRPEGSAWAVELARSAYADTTASRLRGVLVPASGPAVEIDAAVAGAPMAPAGDAPARSAAWMLLLAFGGGLLLNLMPCVFPVLSLKVLSFAQGHDPAELRRSGLAFGAGVVVSFVALAGLLVALRAGGASLGWGFQLQSPPVVAALAALMTLLALSLFGVVELGAGLASASARLDTRSGPAGAFGSGVLAVAVASPCTAPLMGAALGWALAQPAGLALVAFAVLGVGMALPVVALSFWPGLSARLPRPGAWMETLKQALAFPLLLTAVWLVWVFGRQTGIDGAATLLAALVLVGLAAWVLGRWPSARVGARARWTTRTVAVALVLVAAALVGRVPAAAAETGGSGGWEPFDADRVAALVADGQPVFVDYTAAWCLTCQVNKRTTLRTDAVEAAFAQAGVVRVEADWTDRDPTIERSLASFGRSGVPLYVLYPGGGREPVLLPEVLTPDLVIDALDGVGTSVAAAE